MKYKTFTVEIRVSQNWIDDGFDMTEERCRQIAEELLPYAEESEVSVKRVSPAKRRKQIDA